MSENFEIDIGRALGNEGQAQNGAGTANGPGATHHNGNGAHNSSKAWTRGRRPDWQNPRPRRRKPQAQLPYSETILKDPDYKLPFDPWRLFEAMKLRWLWLVLGGGGAALLMMLLGLWLIDYSVSVRLVRSEIPNAFRTGESAQTYQPREFSEETLMDLMRTPELMDRVSAATKPPIPAWKLAKMTKVSPTQNPDVVILTAKGKGNLQGMVDVVNAYATEIIRFTRQMQSAESSEVNLFLSNRLAVVDADIKGVQRQLQLISPTAGFGNFQKETEEYLTELNKIDLKLETAKTDREVLDERIAYEKEQLTKLTPVNDQLQAAREELRKLLLAYTEKHPFVIQKQAEIKLLEQQPSRPSTNAIPGLNPTVWGQTLSTQIRDLEVQRVGLQKEIDRYQALLDSQKTKKTNLSVQAMRFAEVQSTLDSLKLQRKLLETQYQESEIFMGSAMGYYKALAPASIKSVNRKSRWIKVGLMTCFGGVLGLLTVAGLIMLAEAMDSRLKTAVDVERTTQLPLLATLGDLRKMDPAAQVLWAFRTLTILRGKLSRSSDQALVCGFISSTHGEGRSTWINLLVNAASQRGLRVLTVDTRPTAAKPEVSSPAKEEGAMSLSRNVLASPMEVTEQLTDPNAQPVVHIPLPGWVWNLERRTQWQDALAHWKEIDNLVLLVELPPASQPEAILLAEKLPQIIWLTGSGLAEANDTVSQLETLRHAHCNLVGAVLNQEPSTFWKRHLVRWFPKVSVAAAFVLSCQMLQASEAISADSQPEASANLTFSVSAPIKRAAWQQRLTLGPGDALDFALFGHPELVRTNIVVGPDGRLSYLQAADIPVVGMTIEELRARMDEELAKYYVAPRTIVTPVAFNSKKYFMLGKVVTKGVFTMDRPLTVIEAVARARGLETGLYERNTVELADLGHSFLVREGKKMPVDFQKLFLEGDLSQNIPLEPNDYLYFAGTAVNEIYILGEVINPGPLGFTPNATMIAALTDRGGFTDRAYKKKVLVIRGSLNQPETFIVDTMAILTAKEPDFKLQPKDIVYVSARPWIKVEELLDAAAEAFIQGAITTWSGANIGPVFTKPILPQL